MEKITFPIYRGDMVKKLKLPMPFHDENNRVIGTIISAQYVEPYTKITVETENTAPFVYGRKRDIEFWPEPPIAMFFS